VNRKNKIFIQTDAKKIRFYTQIKKLPFFTVAGFPTKIKF